MPTSLYMLLGMYPPSSSPTTPEVSLLPLLPISSSFSQVPHSEKAQRKLPFNTTIQEDRH